MGIKRCPSFSKRPGFPCGLRVLLVDGDTAARSHAEGLLKDCSYAVTPCSSTAEALALLNSGSSFDVLLADKDMLAGKACSSAGQQLLDMCQGVPCILMAANPAQEDIMTGIQLGAVDFLAKPLSPLKLQNIWQHTVRKMMGNMNINCSSDSTAAGSVAVQPAGTAAAAPATAARKELDAMEVIPEEPEREQAAAGEAAGASAAAAADSSAQQLKRPAVNTAANMALATMSSLYEPARCPSLSLSRCGSSAATELSFSLTTPAGSAGSGPDSPCKGPSGGAHKLHKSRHAPVHSCPSTRSLNSMASSYSTLQLAVPGSPGSPSNDEAAAEPAAAACPASVQQLQQQRSIKKAVRHPTPVTPASKPPLASKPQAAAAAAASAAAAQAAAPQQQPAAAPKAGTQSVTAGLSAVPLPTGLGALPQGMVWGMPMCPLARAPGIVPPASSSSSSGSQQGVASAAGMGMPSMSAWGMCGMPMGMPPMPMPGMQAPFMPGFMMQAMPPMAMAFGGFGNPAAAAAPGMMGGYSMPGSVSAFEAAAMQQQQHDAAAAAAAPVSCLPQQQQSGAGGFTGASAAAALAASLGGSAAAADTAAAAATLDIGDAFDFMLGDITAEDDLDVNMIHSGLLDGELTALEREGLKLPADLAELQEQQQQQQRYQQQQAAQQRASMEAGSSRLSFDCHGRQRVSFDCSAASTTTGARVSFECSAASRGNIAGHQQRVSFEVNCNSAARGAAIAAAATAAAAAAAPQMAPPAFCAAQKQAAAAPSGKAAAAAADPLLGSMSDLFAACSGDSCSEGSGGMTHVDSCGMLADLQSLFGPGGGCAGMTDDGCSGVAAAAAAAGLFDDVMDDLPLELSMKKSNSLAELLTTMQA